MKKIYLIISIIILAGLAFSNVFEVVEPVRAISTEGLVGWWKMDDNLATTAVVDETGTNNGTLTDAGGDPGATTAAHSAVSLHNRALTFDGTDDYVKVPHDVSINPTEAITVEAWVKSDTENWPYDGMLVSKRNAYILHPRNNQKQVRFDIHNGATWLTTDYYILTDITAWHHFIGTYDSATKRIKLYVDGVLQKNVLTAGGTINADTGEMNIGKDDGVARYLDGQIDQVRIYNRALSADEIALHYFLESETRIKNATIKNAEIK